MADEKVGYKNPPVATRFKKGVCPNPKGRGKKKSLEAGRIFGDVINSMAEVSDRGASKRLPKMELLIRRLAASAVKGNIKSADLLLSVLTRSETMGDFKAEIIWITETQAKARAILG